MINIRELRIGNLIYYKGYDGFKKVESIEKLEKWRGGYRVVAGTNNFMTDLISASPIPLTTTFLLENGFKKSYSENRAFEIYYHPVGDFCLTAVGGIISFGGTIKIKHIHQLQNLYFSLTGEELNIVKYETVIQGNPC